MLLVDSILRKVARSRIADTRVDFTRLPAFRAEHFPDSGPRPWLDNNDLDDSDWTRRLDSLPVGSATLCRQWAEHGYVVLPSLIPGGLLDETWNAYERAVQTRAVRLEAEPAGEGDTLPGRYL